MCVCVCVYLCIDDLIIKFIWKYKGLKIVKIILKKNKAKGTYITIYQDL